MKHATHYQQIEKIFASALAAVNPITAVSQNLSLQNSQLTIGPQTVQLAYNSQLFLVSIGKASVPMGKAAVDILGNQLTNGIVLTKEGAPTEQFPAQVKTVFGSHPIASEKSIVATQTIEKLLEATSEHDVVLCLISGGASALFTKPLLTLATWQNLNKALLNSGCSINEFNSVRRQLDSAKGGGLANWAYPAKSHSLILSDVIGNDLAAIGSAPTFYADDNISHIESLFDKYGIYSQITVQEQKEISTAVAQLKNEPPLRQPNNTIIGDITLAAKSAAQVAKTLGYTTQILTTQFTGEARELGKFVAAIGKDLPAGRCMILGGESTVTIQGNGYGGRNSEIGLASAISLDGHDGVTIASLATDGDDGLTQSAGVVIDGEVVKYGREQNLNPETYLKNNDSGTYLQKIEQQTKNPIFINTGLTGTNVNDLIIILKEK